MICLILTGTHQHARSTLCACVDARSRVGTATGCRRLKPPWRVHPALVLAPEDLIASEALNLSGQQTALQFECNGRAAPVCVRQCSTAACMAMPTARRWRCPQLLAWQRAAASAVLRLQVSPAAHLRVHVLFQSSQRSCPIVLGIARDIHLPHHTSPRPGPLTTPETVAMAPLVHTSTGNGCLRDSCSNGRRWGSRAAARSAGRMVVVRPRASYADQVRAKVEAVTGHSYLLETTAAAFALCAHAAPLALPPPLRSLAAAAAPAAGMLPTLSVLHALQQPIAPSPIAPHA